MCELYIGSYTFNEKQNIKHIANTLRYTILDWVRFSFYETHRPKNEKSSGWALGNQPQVFGGREREREKKAPGFYGWTLVCTHTWKIYTIYFMKTFYVRACRHRQIDLDSRHCARLPKPKRNEMANGKARCGKKVTLLYSKLFEWVLGTRINISTIGEGHRRKNFGTRMVCRHAS